MTGMVYQWSGRKYAIKPQIVGSAVARIASRNDGVCHPEDLVAAARNETSQLHKLFTWDDTAAAGKWRTHEARMVINSLVVTITVNDQEVKAPAFCSVGGPGHSEQAEKGYRPVSVVVADPEFRQDALDDVMQKLQALRSRYAAIEALSPVWDALDKIAA